MSSERDNPLLLCVAAEVEARAVLRAARADEALAGAAWRLHALRPGVDLVITGVGKANAASAVATALAAGRHGRVVNLGIAGSLPGSGLELGDALAATASVYADEGLATPGGFVDLATMGFPLSPFPGTHKDPHGLPPDPALFALVRPMADAEGGVATVSTCSGDDELAEAVAERTGAAAEAMEGAAIAFALHNLRSSGGPGAAFLEARVISNTTGRREGQRWDIPLALRRLERLAADLLG